MKRDIIFVTGFFGAPIMESAQRLAAEKGYDLLSLDEEIEKADGRTIRRICMMMGEHEYRNKEYEGLLQIIGEKAAKTRSCEDPSEPIVNKGLIVRCGDGVLLDDMSRALIEEHSLQVVGVDVSEEELWQNAIKDTDTYHAFMHFGTDEKRRAAFHDLWERQRALFASL